MSRSKHTDPRAIRAARRIRAPYAPRSADDPSAQKRLGRLLKQAGISHRPNTTIRCTQSVSARIILQRPLQGFIHPVGRGDIMRLLHFVGPEALYGLRSIALLTPDTRAYSMLPALGRFITPGRIILYAQPKSPWRIPGLIASADNERLTRAGADLSFYETSGITIVNWSKHSLRCFMLYDVLLHEIGHHVLQHHAGKRLRRIARTRDHENFAECFAAYYRSACL